MNFFDIKQRRFLGLSPKDSILTGFVCIYFVAYFVFTFFLNFNYVESFIKDIFIPFLSSLQIALLSALTLGFIYIYQLTKNTSYLYIALCWLAHGFYKVFTIIGFPINFEDGIIQNYRYFVENDWKPITGEDLGYRLIIIGMIALAADLPLFLSGFKQAERKWQHLFIPIIIIVPLLIVTNLVKDTNTNVKVVWFFSPLQSFLILLWLSYKTLYKKVFSSSKELSKYLTIIFILLAIAQLASIYSYSICPVIRNSCKEDVTWNLFWKGFSTFIFLFALGIAFIKVKFELSKKESTEKQLEVKEKQLEVKGEFENLGYLAASIEHELRNPLEVIKNEIDDLNRKFQHDESLTNKFHSLEIQVNRISLAANIIRILRLKKEDFAKRLKGTPVIERIRNSVKYVKKELPLLSEKISIKENEKVKELFIRAFPPYLEQTFVNLLKNSYEAIDRTEKKSGEIIIDSYLIDKDTVGITFRDTGCGFVSEDIPKLTQPDYTKKDISKSESNRGLGLFVCDKIVSLHNGKILFSNNEKGGAEVKLEFPRHFTNKMLKSNRNDNNG